MSEAAVPGTDVETGAETGHPGIDEVLASLDGLDQRPAGEHVQVFEAAHEQLRAALSDPGVARSDGATAPTAVRAGTARDQLPDPAAPPGS